MGLGSRRAPSERLNIAGIGIGGIGWRNLNNMSSENIVALADMDWDYATDTFNDFPDAQKFEDYRRMFDEMGDDIDAVVIATPTTCTMCRSLKPWSGASMCYVQKPLTEVVLMGNLAVRLQDLKRTLQWDGKNMEITNVDPDEQISVVTTDTFEVVDGDPKFNTDYNTINSQDAAQRYIRRPYRDGWSYEV